MRSHFKESFALAAIATLLFWGAILLPQLSLSPEAMIYGAHPACRLEGSDQLCSKHFGPVLSIDAGADAWQSVPVDYFFNAMRLEENTAPRWNPYIGSGYPQIFDGINARYSPVRWYLRNFVGDSSRDTWIWLRMLLWVWGIVFAASLLGVSRLLWIPLGVAAALSPYPAGYLDIVFLDVDMLAPWLIAGLVIIDKGLAARRWILLGAAALGVWVALLGFLQSQCVFLAVAGVLSAAIARKTRGFSLVAYAALVAGFGIGFPAWLPVIRHLGDFVTSRSAQTCIASAGMAWSEIPLFFQTGAFSALHFASLAGIILILSVRRSWVILPTFAFVGLALWQNFGLPSLVCSVPGFSGVRFSRHLVPHAAVLFLLAVTLAAEAMARKPSLSFLKKLFPAVAAASIWPLVTLPGAFGAGPALWALVFLGAVGWGIYELNRRQNLERAVCAALILALAPLGFRSNYISGLLTGNLPAQASPLPEVLNPTSAYGSAIRISRTEDRRHYSPHAILHPNWSAAYTILDLRLLGALYLKDYFAVTAGLFSGWVQDPQHGLKPDRFIGPENPQDTYSEAFQRMMLVHRVSVLSFVKGQSFLAKDSGPYSRCTFAVGDSYTEFYVCGEIGSVGYFPSQTVSVPDTASAVEVLKTIDIRKLLDFTTVEAKDPKPAAGKVAKFERLADSLVYQLEVTEPGYFVVADSYAPGWTATVNGEPVAIAKANGAFKSVLVPTGAVQVQFVYAP